jgi:hypothetical protein
MQDYMKNKITNKKNKIVKYCYSFGVWQIDKLYRTGNMIVWEIHCKNSREKKRYFYVRNGVIISRHPSFNPVFLVNEFGTNWMKEGEVILPFREYKSLDVICRKVGAKGRVGKKLVATIITTRVDAKEILYNVMAFKRLKNVDITNKLLTFWLNQDQNKLVNRLKFKNVKFLLNNYSMKKVIDWALDNQIDRYIVSDIQQLVGEYNLNRPLTNDEKRMGLGELHDHLSRENNRRETENLPIEYPPSFLDRLKMMNSLSTTFVFSVPNSTYEIIDIGSRMGHCIAAYKTQAREQRLIILSAISNDGVEYTIELAIPNREAYLKGEWTREELVEELTYLQRFLPIRQIKGKFNADPSEPHRAEIISVITNSD